VKATTRLRQLLASGQTLVAPGAHDAMTAMILEKLGFDVIYMTGYGTAAAMGMPDVGLATIGEMIRNAQYMANAVSIPIIADSDTGGGNAINVVRTIREYIQAGAAGIHMEDQVTPKRSGHWAGKRLIPLEEAAGKIRAAVDTKNRLDPDSVIVARTDARAAVGGSGKYWMIPVGELREWLARSRQGVDPQRAASLPWPDRPEPATLSSTGRPLRSRTLGSAAGRRPVTGARRRHDEAAATEAMAGRTDKPESR
jgi:phosphoenolpyruvate phosphomutase-like protein